MAIVFDYPTLRVIWWGLMGVLLIGFALTGGWDLGIGALLPLVARTEVERRMAINVAGPTWEGNQVWFILGGGAIFAAWPFVYAVTFSGFYLAMFLVLAALILRPVAFKYRSKRPSPTWRACWDWALFTGGLAPALVFGVAVGNVLEGLPFRLDSDLRTTFEGSLLGLFTPLTLLCGLLSVAMVALHGAAYLALKLERGPVHSRALRYGNVAAILCVALFVAGGVYVTFGPIGYAVVGLVDPGGPSNPLRATVVASPGAWLGNYGRHPWMIAAPVLGLFGAASSRAAMRAGREVWALAGSAAASTGMIATVGLSMFPIIVPSTLDAHSSLLVWNASSTERTLFLMLLVTVVLLPIVLLYTAWVFRVLSGRVTYASIATNPDLY